MNGVAGNFCLDFVGDVDKTTQRATAWSCDVGHYVTCIDDRVVVNRWDRGTYEENYTWRSVLANVHDFHRHLEKSTPDRSKAISAHVLRVFRQVREALGESTHSLRSLHVLLHLLASSALNRRIGVNEGDSSGLTGGVFDSLGPVSDVSWTAWFNDLAGLGRYDTLRPDFDLVLHHASGAVFQDAHLEAELSGNSWLPGLERPVVIPTGLGPTETGAYFTPPAIARTLAEEVVNGLRLEQADSTIRIFDPACGSGELLKECMRLLRLRGFPGNVVVIGWDRSAMATEMARFVLRWESRAWPNGAVQLQVFERDSLLESHWPTEVDALLMNPPFKSWQRMTPEEQEVVGHIVDAAGRPNLAMAFARRALASLSQGGLLGMIAPNSLLEADAGTALRAQIAEVLNPRLVARLGDQAIFARALVDAGMYVGQKSATDDEDTAVLWADSKPHSLSRALRGLRRWRGAEVEPIDEDGFSVYRRHDLGRDGSSWTARSYEAWHSFERIRRIPNLLSADVVFDIRQGVRLGSDVFVLSAEQLATLPKPERAYFRPAVMNPSIKGGRLNRDYFVFYPYSSGLAPIQSERNLREVVGTYFAEYLLPVKSKLAARKTLASGNLKWWDLLRSRNWQVARTTKVVSKYFGDRRPFAFDETGEFVVVVGNAWILRPGALDVGATDDEVYLAALAYLSSGVAEGLIEYLSIQVAGGQWDLSNKYLGRLPFPNFTDLEPGAFLSLVEAGRLLTQGELKQDDLDGIVCVAIGVS